MIKVLSAIVIPPHMSVSGAARAAEQLSSALALHCDVTVASMLNEGDTGGTISQPNSCKRIATRSRLPPLIPWAKLSNRYATLFYKSNLPDIVRRGNFDIVHLHNPMPGLEMERVALACRAKGTPYVVSTHGFNEIANGAELNRFGPLRRLIWNQFAVRPVQRVTQHAAAVFALSPADFDIVRILTAGGPQDMTHVFATYAFQVGIQSGDIPLGAADSLFMFPILAFAAFFVLRGVTQRTKDIAA